MWRRVGAAVRRGTRLSRGAWLRIAGLVCVLLALGTWSVASPLGSTPDEDFHLTSIWCSHGDYPGMCEPGASSDTRRVSEQLLDATCYWGDATKTAACQEPGPYDLVDSSRGNFSGIYPPVYYYLAGFFAGDDVTRSVLAIRIANTFLYLGLLTAVYLLVSPGLRRGLLAGALLTAVPLGVFLIPSINPTSWSILSGTTTLISVVGYLTSENRTRRVALAVLAGLSVLIGAGARADSASYAVLAIVVAVILTARRPTVTPRRLALPAVLAVLALVSFLGARQSGNPGQAPLAFKPLIALDSLMQIPSLWVGALGGPPPHENMRPEMAWGLGARDTAMPSTVWLGMWSLYIAILVLALAKGGRRRSIAVGTVAVAAFVIPAYYNQVAWEKVGGIIQPRYILPLLIILLAAAVMRLDGPAFRIRPALRWALVVVLSVANALALYANLKRNVVGVQFDVINLDSHVQWWWTPSPLSPMAVWAIGAVTFAAGVVLLSRELTEPVDAVSADAVSVDSGPGGDGGLPSAMRHTGAVL